MPPERDYVSKTVFIHSVHLEDRYPLQADTYVPVDVEMMQYLLEKTGHRAMQFTEYGNRLSLCTGRQIYVFWGESEPFKLLVETVQRRWCKQEIILSGKLKLPPEILRHVSCYLQPEPAHRLPPPQNYVTHYASGPRHSTLVIGDYGQAYRFSSLVSDKSIQQWLKKKPQENPSSAT